MTDNHESGVLLPGAMARGVEKDGWRIIGPGGGGALYFPAICPGDPNTVLVGCDMTGAYLTRNGGQSWQEINLKSRPMAFAFDPTNPTTIYAGASGLYRSNDAGKRWQLVFPDPARVTAERIAGDHADHSYLAADGWPGGQVETISIDPRDSRKIYLGVCHNTLSLFVSTNGGASWVEQGQMEGKHFRASYLACLEEQVYVFLLTDAGLYRYDPQTARLEMIKLPGGPAVYLSGGIDPASERAVLFITSPGGWARGYISGIYRSIDLGQTWQPLNQGLDASLAPGRERSFTAIATCAQNANVVYAAVLEPPDQSRAAQDHFGIFASRDMGQTWAWVLEIGASNPPNRKLGWIEQDFGTTWGGAPFYLGVSPDHAEICYALDWGTAYRTVDGGETWQQIYCQLSEDKSTGTIRTTTSGLDLTNIYWVVFDPFDREHLALPCTDIGLFHSTDGGRTWQHGQRGVPEQWTLGCYQLVFDPAVPGRAWSVWAHCHDLPRPKMFKPATLNNPGGVCKTEDGLQNWIKTSTGLPDRCLATDIILDPLSPPGKRTLYLAAVGQGVFKSIDDGHTWKACIAGIKGRSGNEMGSANTVGVNAWRLVRAPDGRLYLLVCRGLENGHVIDGALYTSMDGAEHWQLLNLPHGVNFPNDLACDPSDPERLYLACWPTQSEAGACCGGLYRSEDSGATWAAVYDTSAHVYGVAVDPGQPQTVIITCFEGQVHRSDDCGQNWRVLGGFNFKWPKQPIFDPYNPGMLYLTTFGSSVWYGPAEGAAQAQGDIVE